MNIGKTEVTFFEKCIFYNGIENLKKSQWDEDVVESWHRQGVKERRIKS